MRSLGALLLLGTLVTGCSKKANEGLPPASEWKAGDEQMAPPTATRAGSMPTNPHGAAGTGAGDPHAGMDIAGAGGDPHAGMDMTGGGGPDVTQMGLEGPDPSRPIDPNRRITGVIKVHPKAKGHVLANGAIFLTAKRASKDGNPEGPPLAVDKLIWAGDSVTFELTEAKAMIKGTELTGDVILAARFDQDADAMTKDVNDVIGTARVKVPSAGVELTLDTLVMQASGTPLGMGGGGPAGAMPQPSLPPGHP